MGMTRWKALCPAHDDHDPSLTITEGTKKVLLKCWSAGCAESDILKAAGLGADDVWYEPKQKSATGAKVATVYPYTDETGELLYEVVRRLDASGKKTFRQRRLGSDGKYTYSVEGTRRVLYQLDAIQGQKSVAIVEGEKDADRLTGAGILATTNSGGAGKWTDEHSSQLKAAGVRSAFILGDNDPAGREHVATVEKSCRKYGLVTWTVNLPGLAPKGDVSDWLDAGHSVDEIRELVQDHAGLPPGQVLLCG
jgi:hypothetical protein